MDKGAASVQAPARPSTLPPPHTFSFRAPQAPKKLHTPSRVSRSRKPADHRQIVGRQAAVAPALDGIGCLPRPPKASPGISSPQHPSSD
ncbi:hypothetical protein NDU88_006945 [Pleurodeles waltl]|uniref:Uncharacterized protein n=1 Tax=Pleurodeles waltl TaxID=8319 RepID=A0AAV7QJA8_PLEWA|nr:hypothetical protein NDU88_006945 [Pleurodeles waltl]